MKNVLDISSSLLHQINTSLHMYEDVHGITPTASLDEFQDANAITNNNNSNNHSPGPRSPSPLLGVSPPQSPDQQGNSPHSPPAGRGGRTRQSIISIKKAQEEIRRTRSEGKQLLLVCVSSSLSDLPLEEEYRKDLANLVFDYKNPLLPAQDRLLGTMETIMHGELYVNTFTWSVSETALKITAKCFLST